MTVLVTGGTGMLGRVVVPALLEAEYPLRVMSRRARAGGGVQWVRADLSTGEGLPEAVGGIDTVVHLASAPYRGPYTAKVDVQGTARLAAAARSAGVRHLLYVSIVGVDVVPWSYFRQKLAAERVVTHGGMNWSILRLTQFHPFLDRALRVAGRLPVAFTDPGITVQPLDLADAAERLVQRVQHGPSDAIEEFAGPETLTGDQLVEQWLQANGRSATIRSISIPGALGRAFRTGGITTQAQPTAATTWAEYLANQYASTTGSDGTAESEVAAERADGRVPLLDRSRKRRAVLWFERRVQNPTVRAMLRAGVPLPMFALVETTGRKTGEPRQTQLINGLDGDTFWIVSEHGRRSAYVKNLETDPRVRVYADGHWRTGTAHVLDDDDPIARASWMSRSLGRWHKADGVITRLFGTEPLTIRVDLDPVG